MKITFSLFEQDQDIEAIQSQVPQDYQTLGYEPLKEEREAI